MKSVIFLSQREVNMMVLSILGHNHRLLNTISILELFVHDSFTESSCFCFKSLNSRFTHFDQGKHILGNFFPPVFRFDFQEVKSSSLLLTNLPTLIGFRIANFFQGQAAVYNFYA